MCGSIQPSASLDPVSMATHGANDGSLSAAAAAAAATAWVDSRSAN